MRDLADLTTLGQARRLAQLARHALLRYGTADASLRLLATSYDTVYRVTWRGQRFVCRVSPPQVVHAPGVDEAELAWTTRMAAAGAAVPAVVPAADGAASVTVAVDGVPGPRTCMLLTWVPGRPLPRSVTPADAADLGALAAHLHDLAPTAVSLPPGVLDGRSVLLFPVPDRLGQLRSSFGTLFDDARDRAQAAVDAVWARGSTAAVHHGDLTWVNVVRQRRALVPVDCQDLTWGTVEQDLAATAYSVTAGGSSVELLEPFRQGYASRRPWPVLADEALPGLLPARRLQVVHLALHLRRPGLGAYLERHAAALRG